LSLRLKLAKLSADQEFTESEFHAVGGIGGAENAGVENAGVENAGVDSRGGKCRSGKCRSR